MTRRTPGQALFVASVSGPLRLALGRTVLAIVAIALGVALGFAIYLINRAAADEVSIAARSLFGLADLAVEDAGEGFDEALYPVIARLPGIKVASPVVQVEAKLVDRRGSLTLLGMDMFRSRQLQPAFAAMGTAGSDDHNARRDGEPIFLSASAARSLNLKVGDALQVQVGLRPQEFVVAAILPGAILEDRAGVIDIATAQWRFERLGKLSRLNLKLAPGANTEQVRATLTPLLPPGTRIVTPGEAASDAARLSRAYRSNLGALALVALFTGGFFVYSTQSLATLRRRREFALLHALGVTRREQLQFALLGGLIMGVIGALIGIAAGIALAHGGLKLLGSDLGAGYFRGTAPTLNTGAGEATIFFALGVIVAVVGTLQPALEAARIPTAAALKASDVASSDVRSHGAIVTVMLLLAVIVLWLPPVAGLPVPGYVSIALFIGGTVVAMPVVLRSLLARAPRFKAVPWEMAISHLRGTARHATLSVSAIVVSFSLMVAMAIMVTSFRHSLDAWTQRLLPADLYLRAGYVGQSSYFEPAAVERLRRIEGVANVEVSRFAETRIGGGKDQITLIARDLDAAHADRVLWLEAASDAPAPAGTVAVWISQAAADAMHLRPGDTFGFSLAGEQVRAFVRGVWRDYEHVRGAVVMPRDVYVALTGDSAINTIWFWLKPGIDADTVQQRIRDALPAGISYDMRTPGELRRLSLQVFDRTFAVTYALELIAILIGLFGIAAGTSAQVLARRREFGVLRHIGLTRDQVAATLAIEGAGLGALGVIAGLVAGAVVSLILIRVVNRQSFHWSMDLFLPVEALSILSATLIGAAALIAVVSGRQAMRGEAIAAVKEDW